MSRLGLSRLWPRFVPLLSGPKVLRTSISDCSVPAAPLTPTLSPFKRGERGEGEVPHRSVIATSAQGHPEPAGSQQVRQNDIQLRTSSASNAASSTPVQPTSALYTAAIIGPPPAMPASVADASNSRVASKCDAAAAGSRIAQRRVRTTWSPTLSPAAPSRSRRRRFCPCPSSRRMRAWLPRRLPPAPRSVRAA